MPAKPKVDISPAKIMEEPIRRGPKNKITPEVIERLRQGFLIGANREQACAFAGISKQLFYTYIKTHPEIIDDIERWEASPILKAKQIVISELDKKDSATAKWYLEKRDPDFKNKLGLEVEQTGSKLQEVLETYDQESKTDEQTNIS
ncbi:hypothetical protein [Polynucleobacter sp.]|uniref:hypothetical protein n=1 Tax=Polynucleobacter sp. TaxID=2029855 RepID=UPI003F694E87